MNFSTGLYPLSSSNCAVGGKAKRTAVVFVGLFILGFFTAMIALPEAAITTWVQATRDGGFPHRDSARVFSFMDRIFISGGYQYGGAALQDLYFSGNGENWTMALAKTPYPTYTPAAVHSGKVFFVGADSVRSTTDLVSYLTVLSPTPFTDSLVEAPLIGDFAGKLWLILPDKIRYSTDGTTWDVATVPWSGTLVNLTAIKHDGYIYIFGGAYESADPLPKLGYRMKAPANKVWRTADPINGTWEEFEAPWGARLWPQSISHQGSIYLLGGYSNIAASNFDDVWKCTTDMECRRLPITAVFYREIGTGAYISQGLTNLSYTARHWPAVFSFNGYVWFCGGNRNPDGPGTMNDCWYLRE